MLIRRSAKASGFTLIELMMVLVIAVILASLAAPALATFIATQQLKTASFDLYAGLAFARTEAVKYGSGTVRIKPVSSDWKNGWTIFYRTTGGAETLLRSHDALPKVTFTDPGSNAYFEFRRDGRPTSTISLTLTVTGHSEIQGRCVSADPSGSPNTKLQPSGGC